MRAIESVIRDDLNEFLSLRHRDYFEQDHGRLISAITAEQYVGNNQWLPAFEVFSDAGISFELANFAAELTRWSREVASIREQYFYDTVTNELPADYRAAFGYTSPVMIELDSLVSRCRRLVRQIDILHAKVKVITSPQSRVIEKPDPESIDYAMGLLTKNQKIIARAVEKARYGLSAEEILMLPDAFTGDVLKNAVSAAISRINGKWRLTSWEIRQNIKTGNYLIEKKTFEKN